MGADNKTLIQNFQRDIDTGHASILDSYVGTTYNDHNPPPFASKTPGMAGLKETFNIGLDMFADFKHVIDQQVSEGNLVATRITGSGKHVGPFLNVPPTNKIVTMSGIAIHRIVDGKLVEHWGQVDGLGLLAQMGAVPTPPSPPALPPPQRRHQPGDVASSPERMKVLLRRVFGEVINGRHQAAADELIDPAYVNYSMPMRSPGPRGLREVVDVFFAAFPDLQVVVDDIIAEEDKAATRGRAIGTQKGTFLNVPPTGKTITIPYIDIWKAQNGRLIENWVQMDMLGALVQLGAIPAPPS